VIEVGVEELNLFTDRRGHFGLLDAPSVSVNFPWLSCRTWR